MARISRRRVVLAVRICFAGIAAVRWAFDRVEVEGDSMLPSFAQGDRLLLMRRWRAPRPGDVVAVDDPRHPGRRLVKRVSALDGGQVVIHGDHAAASTDSRSFGPVPMAAVTHFVVHRYVGARAS
jgi:nickel-type superoxide dismutase maturation protease